MAIAVAEPVGLFATASRDRIAYVARLDGAGPHMTLQHADEVTSLAFSPDHSFLVSGGFDGWAIVWDVATGRKLHRLKHAEDIHAVVFSPGVHLLITAESGRQARVWRVADWTALHLLPHDGRVYRASFNPDGSRIATASEDSTAAIWDAVTGARLFTLKHQYPVSQAVFSPDGSMLATASMDRGARLWSVATGEHLHHFAHGAEVTDVAFSPDGKRLATASDDHHASIFDTATGDTVARLRHDDTVTRVAFSRDCTQLLTSSLDGTARIWRADARQPASSAPYVRTAAEVTEHLYSPDGTLDIVGWPEDDGTVRIQRAADHVELYQISHDRQRINSVIFSPDSRLIATGADDRTARLWISTTGAELARLIHNGPVQNAVFSADGRSLLTVTKVWEFGGEDIARLWDVATGTLLWHLPSSNVRSTKFAADGRTIVTYGDDGIAHTWDAALVLAERDDAFVCTIATEYLRGAGKLTDAELLLLRPILGENLEREVTARWASAM